MSWIDALERIINILRGPALTPEQMDARSKTRIITTFCLILVMMVAAFILNTTSVEQPMKDIAPADKFNYDTLKLIATQIFTVLTLLLGAKAVSGSAVPTPPTINQTVTVDNKDENDVKSA
jgi:hypothetical protein